jgi:hypothetical protein
VGDDQRRAVLHDVVQRVLDMALRLGVERRGRLVENQDRRVLQDGAGDGQALALTAREEHAVFSDQGVVGVRQLFDEFLGVSRFGRLFDVGARRAGQIAVGDVVRHGVVEQRRLLGDQRDMAAQVAQRVVLDIDAVDQDLAVFMVVEARNQVGERDLPLPERPTSATICPGSMVKLMSSSTFSALPG